MTQLFEAGNLGAGKVAKNLFSNILWYHHLYARKELAANSSLFGTS